MGKCLFRTHYKDTCDKNTSQLTQKRDKKRIESIIKASKIRGDTLHERLSDLLKQDSNLKVDFHYSCVSKYCSPKTSNVVVVLRVHVSLVIVPVTSLAYPAQAFVNVKMVLVASIYFD